MWHSSTVGQPFRLSTRWWTSTSVEAYSCLPNCECAKVHRTRELATKQPRHQSSWLLDLGSTAITCLSTEDSGSWSLERSVDELLETDQPGIDRESNRPVGGQNFVGDSGQRRVYWTTFELRLPCDMYEKHSFRWLQNLGYFRLLLCHFMYAYLFAYFSQNNWVAWISL